MCMHIMLGLKVAEVSSSFKQRHIIRYSVYNEGTGGDGDDP